MDFSDTHLQVNAADEQTLLEPGCSTELYPQSTAPEYSSEKLAELRAIHVEREGLRGRLEMVEMLRDACRDRATELLRKAEQAAAVAETYDAELFSLDDQIAFLSAVLNAEGAPYRSLRAWRETPAPSSKKSNRLASAKEQF